MANRFFNTVEKNEVLGINELEPLPLNVVLLPPENVFLLPLPDNQELTFDGGGVPNGTQQILTTLQIAIAAKVDELLNEYDDRVLLTGYPIDISQQKTLKAIYISGGGVDLELDDLFTNGTAAKAAEIFIQTRTTVAEVIVFDVVNDVPWA